MSSEPGQLTYEKVNGDEGCKGDSASLIPEIVLGHREMRDKGKLSL